MRKSLMIAAGMLLASGAGAQEASWKAGVARVNITPDKLMWMSGYAARTKPAQGKLTDLWAKALVLEDARGRRGVLITMDLVGIERALSVEVRAALNKKYGLGREALILACSHTHSGPVVRSNLNVMYDLDATQQEYVRNYGETLRAKLVQVVGEALAKMTPAKVSWGIGRATFAVNRRNNKEADVVQLRAAGRLQGPVDHDVPVLAVRDAHDGLLAIVHGYACHATVLSSYEWCGDYPGYSQTHLEKMYPGAQAMFWAGCGGDQNPLPRRTVALAEAYGKALADAVKAVLDAPMTPARSELSMAFREIELPFAELPTREQLAKDAGSDKKHVANRAKLLLGQMAAKGSLRGTYPYPVQVWRVGDDLDWVALGGEVVVDYALRLKKEMAAGKTWVTAYANDVMAYIPSLRVLKEGGYEGGGAMLYYGLPTVWSPRVEDMIVAAVHELAQRVSR